MRNYPSDKISFNHIDEIWSIDLADMIDYKKSNNKCYRYIFNIFDNFAKHLWAIPLKNKYSPTITEEVSNNLSTSKRSPLKIESDRGPELFDSIFQHFLKNKKNNTIPRFTVKGTSIAGRVIKTIRSLIRKPVFHKGNANWLIELPVVIEQYNNTNRSSEKITLNQASKKINEKVVYNKLKDNREIQKPTFNLAVLVRTADIKRIFSEGDSTNWSYKLYTITEVLDVTIPSYRINYLPERYNENLLRPSILALEQNNQVMKKLNLFK